MIDLSDNQILALAEMLEAAPHTRVITGPRGGMRKVDEFTFELPKRSRHPKIEKSNMYGTTRYIIWNTPLNHRADPTSFEDALECAEAFAATILEITSR